MHSFFIKEKITSNTFIPSKELLHQLKNVLKIKPTKKIIIINDNAKFNATFDGKKITLIDKINITKDNKHKVTLIQGMPKNSKIDFIIQKATEIGVDEIFLFNAIRSISKIEDGSIDSKLNRYNKIATEASEQSKRNNTPEIKYYKSLIDLVKENDISNSFTLYEDEKKEFITIDKIKKTNNISVIIGPEGGLDKKEIELLSKNNSNIVTLPTNILRTETAAIYILSIINFVKGVN